MPLYESLDHFVAAGLIVCAPAVGCDLIGGVPERAADRATILSAHLRACGEAEPFGALLDALARDIWLGQETRGIPHTMAELHAREMAPLLIGCAPAPERLAAALLAGPSTAPALAAGMMAKLVATPAWQRIGLREDVASQLLEDFLRHLLADPSLLPSLRPALESFATADGLTAPTAPASAAQSAPSSPPAPPVEAPLAAAATADSHSAPLALVQSPASQRKPTAASPPIPLSQTTTIRRPLSERVRAVVADRASEAGAVASIRHRYALSDGALARFMEALDRQQVPADRRMSRLEEMAAWLETSRRQLTRPTSDAPETRQMKQDAANALATGHFEHAADVLRQVRRAARTERRTAEQRLRGEIETLRQAALAEAAATAELAQIAMTALRFDEAADHFEEAQDALPADCMSQRIAYALRTAEVRDLHAEAVGDATSLQQACDAWRAVQAIARTQIVDHSAAAVAADLGFADAAARMGGYLADPTALQTAAESYRRVQAILPPDADPDVTRRIDLRLGRTLLAQAQLQQGLRPLLQEAAVRLGRAAEGLPRRQSPRDWAAAHASLGETLLRMSSDPTDKAAAPLWAEAIRSLRLAAEELSREAAPLEWGLIQLNLGIAHSLQGAAGESQADWIAAASALVPAVEIFEEWGEAGPASDARSLLKDLRDRFEALPPAAARA